MEFVNLLFITIDDVVQWMTPYLCWLGYIVYLVVLWTARHFYRPWSLVLELLQENPLMQRLWGKCPIISFYIFVCVVIQLFPDEIKNSFFYSPVFSEFRLLSAPVLKYVCLGHGRTVL